jgi:hypothetical protein
MAVAVGLAVVTFMTVVATAVKAAIASSVDDVISAELVVQSSRNEMLGGLSPHVHHHASEVDGVAAASRPAKTKHSPIRHKLSEGLRGQAHHRRRLTTGCLVRATRPDLGQLSADWNKGRASWDA